MRALELVRAFGAAFSGLFALAFALRVPDFGADFGAARFELLAFFGMPQSRTLTRSLQSAKELAQGSLLMRTISRDVAMP